MPRWRLGPLRGRWLLVILVAVGIGLVLAVSMVPSPTPGFSAPSSTGWGAGPRVTVLDVDLIPWYENDARNATGFLTQADCGCAPLSVASGGTFGWSLSLENGADANHTLLKLALDPPFTLMGVSSTVPGTLPAHGDLQLTLEILAPTAGGEYIATGGVWVS